MQTDQPRVLLVTRLSFAEPVADELRREAVVVEIADALDALRLSAFAVAVVELGHAEWTTANGAGVSVIVYADRADCDTVIELLGLGADDVITRGDRLHEAVSRIRAVARRHTRRPDPDRPLTVGEVELDPIARRATRDGRALVLTRRQFDLLEYLMRNAGIVVTRDKLLEHVWDMAATQEPNAVEVQIRRLREALGDDVHPPRLLKTVRGVGYLFERT